MDYATAGKSVGASIKAYGDALAAGSQPPVAFNTAFGMTTTAFYDQFLTYEAAFVRPASDMCGWL
jgi:hypothetical protein